MDTTIFMFQSIIAAIFGAVLGWQRHHVGRAAGIRTFATVSLGSALFTMMAVQAFGGESGRVVAQIISGIGFLGAGTIIHKSGGVEGLTTAAGLWATAAIGMAVGLGWYLPALITTILLLGIFFLRRFE